MTRLEQALALARRGLNIFPLRPGTKEPFSKADMDGRGWKEYATTDEAVIRHWFETIPDMNYAVNPPRDVVILDPDLDERFGKNGKAVLSEFESEQEDMDTWIQGFTFEVKTPRGGSHLYLTTPRPIGNSRSKIGQGIDTRGFDGYVVGPGSHTVEDLESHTAEGTYEVVKDGDFMAAPDWLLTKIAGATFDRDENSDTPLFEYDTPSALDKARILIQQQTEWAVEGHEGSNFTYQFACAVKDCCVSEEMTLDLMTEPYALPGESEAKSWNERCTPPWPENQLQRVIENAYKYGKNPPGAKGGLLALAGEVGSDAWEQNELKRKHEMFAKLESITFAGGSLTDRDVRREYVVSEWLLAHGYTVNLAKRQVGKTVVSLDLALRIARDDDNWFGYPIAKGWAVVFACGEDDLGLQEQMIAWSMQNGELPSPDRFIVMTAAPNAMNGEELAVWAEYLSLKLGGRRAVLVVDTWQRAVSGGAQNDDKEMKLASDNIEALCKALHGCAIINAHPPKNNEGTISGSGVIENNCVGIWQGRKLDDGHTRNWTVIRLKGKGEGNYFKFTFCEIELGEDDQFGKPRTGLVVKCDGSSIMEISDDARGRVMNAKAIYATVISDLLSEYHDKRQDATSKRDFSAADAAQRISTAFKNNPNKYRRWIHMLGQNNDTAWNNPNNLKRRLGEMFKDGNAQRCIDSPFMVRLRKINEQLFQFEHDRLPETELDDDLSDL